MVSVVNNSYSTLRICGESNLACDHETQNNTDYMQRWIYVSLIAVIT